MLIEDKRINETLGVLMEELKEECETFTKLANRLEREDLTEEQFEELMGEIMASVVSLKVHSEHVEEELYSSDND
ncbi:MAG: hypothetical protein HY097_08445 [Nitrospinae bacterium]|nr:hypothetical protein [Nitrospinota bacterium]